jgi:hypothetical protein
LDSGGIAAAFFDAQTAEYPTGNNFGSLCIDLVLCGAAGETSRAMM